MKTLNLNKKNDSLNDAMKNIQNGESLQNKNSSMANAAFSVCAFNLM